MRPDAGTCPPPPLCGGTLRFRDAVTNDAAAIAALHAASWRVHYRGSLSEAYLAGPIEEERRKVWSERLCARPPEQVTVVAEDGRHLLGFVCAFVNHDSAWGTLIDNLHVGFDHKGAGIGRRLMHEVAARLMRVSPDRPVYLTVLGANGAAQAFYDRIGGEVAEHTRQTLPDGSEVAVLRYAWPSPLRLRHAASAAPEEKDQIA